MIHIEGDWYIRVNGYKDYTMGRLATKKKTGKKELTDCTYYCDLRKAVESYIEISSENVLENKNIELIDAFSALRQDYNRLIQLVNERVPKTLD